MRDRRRSDTESLSPSRLQQVDEICDRFERAWKTGHRPRIEEYLDMAPPEERAAWLRELLCLELAYRRREGETLTQDEYQQRFPALANLVAEVFLDALGVSGRHAERAASSLPTVCTETEEKRGKAAIPAYLGRYRIVEQLGSGGFGVVYKGYDEELGRPVAIKVPHARRVTHPEEVELYLAEARTLASLDHPNIVPVHDVGRTEDGLCFVVSKYIEGCDLAQKIKKLRPSYEGSAELVATLADALHYAHRKNIVHRDIKPSNILIEPGGKPYLADFGLALKEEDLGKGPGFAGTPAYMSPEQARGEGHRVDGRSDIFSLGVVFYELLTGRRPFTGDSAQELLEKIATVEPRPPRQRDESIPKELERICLKALSKRASERYSIAKDMNEDLRCWLSTNRSEGSGAVAATPQPASAAPGTAPSSAATGRPTATPTPCTNLDSDQPANVIPKGLRSFDANDADFFLALVPGPRNREGLPESLRFWKGRVEQIDSENTFPVGLLYGPSGCGKSSLIKAGLLPRLAAHVVAIYIEAAAQQTEDRLLRALRRHCPDLPDDLGLTEAFAALRRGRFLPSGKRVLVILDQFEQWLHAPRAEQETELLGALRQCDGERLQGLLMVRDDYWMAATRFMEGLEIPLVQGENTAAVDLFDLRHAKKVLTAFGRAFGVLPEPEKKLTKEQAAFLDQAVQDLAQNGKVISVRLALFAEMVKGKPWVPATLQHLGGIAGVGVAFLEETFAASTAPPQHRFHRKAAQATLKRLMPETGTELRGPMRSRQELLQASGYGSRPKEFEDLLRILDSELRLLTPADPESVGPEDRPMQTRAGEQYYQLTHDYLVPSLQTWLSRKQKESRRGRAELHLAERAALWSTNPENRFLPAWWEWADIGILTRRPDWTPAQRKMMARATRYHALRLSLWAAAFLLLGWVGFQVFGEVKAQGLRDQLLMAQTSEIPTIVADMAPYRRWLDPLLRDAFTQAKRANDPRKLLHVSLALLPVDSDQRQYLYERLLSAEPNEVAVIRDMLAPFRQEMSDSLWAVVEQPAQGRKGRRLRAACALANYDPENPRWQKTSGLIVEQLVAENPVLLNYWIEGFRPIQQKLLDPLTKLFRDPRQKPTERALAAVILADYTAEQPDVLADLLMDADENQFDVLYAKIENLADQARSLFRGELAKPFPRSASEDAKETLAKRQANAAVALLRMNHPEPVWPFLQHSPDPRARSYLVHRFLTLKADPRVVVKRLHEEQDLSTRRALLLILGGVSEKELPVSEREKLLPELFALYQDDRDPGLHGAVAWVLRQWNQKEKLRQIDLAWAKDKEYRDKTREQIRRELQNNPRTAKPSWYVNSQGQTFTVIPGPVEFTMGSPFTEAGRLNEEVQHRERIDHSFALSTTHVTVAQLKRCPVFRINYKPRELNNLCPAPDCPAIGVSWYMAAFYCDWLSLQEGVPKDQLCYANKNHYRAGMQLAPDYLQRSGYRLPTEAEWEYACRAGAVTSRYYGQCDDLLEQYAWYDKNSQNRTWPVGSLKPNDLGLFDMHGLLWVWCQDSYHPYGLEHAEDTTIEDKVFRLLRGGTFTAKAVNVRSAHRQGYQPDLTLEEVGFRLARTIR